MAPKHLCLFCRKSQTAGKFSKLNLLSPKTRIELVELRRFDLNIFLLVSFNIHIIIYVHCTVGLSECMKSSKDVFLLLIISGQPGKNTLSRENNKNRNSYHVLCSSEVTFKLCGWSIVLDHSQKLWWVIDCWLDLVYECTFRSGVSVKSNFWRIRKTFIMINIYFSCQTMW